MNILIVNDDGPHSPGLKSLISVLKENHNLTIVVPHRSKSGLSHCMSFFDTMEATKSYNKELSINIWLIKGTPADCTILAIDKLCPQKPDLVISGINTGLNAADSVYCSATVAAAYEGFRFHIPSIAVSAPAGNYQYTEAAKLLEDIIPQLITSDPCFYNINFPECEPGFIKGIKNTFVSPQYMNSYMIEQPKSEGTNKDATAYRYCDYFTNPEAYETGSDGWALKHNYISISPLKVDYSDYNALQKMPEIKLKAQN